MLFVGASPATAATNFCTNETRITDGGTDDLFIQVLTVVGVGVDTGISTTLDGAAVCINDTTYRLTFDPTASLTVRLDNCVGTTCSQLLDTTGASGSLAPSTSGTPLIVCALTCTSVPVDPRAPFKVDTGYDVLLDGNKVADLCIAVGRTC